MTHTIISKRPTAFTYTSWVYKNGQIFSDGPGIVINGGAGVVGGADLLSGRKMEDRSKTIPGQVMTFVDDIVLAKLMTIPKFKSDLKRGIIEVVKGKITESKAEEVARSMIPDEQIPNRPYSAKDFEDAGGVINKDGSVDISTAEENIDAIRRQNAGSPEYVKKRESQKRREQRKEKARANKRR